MNETQSKNAELNRRRRAWLDANPEKRKAYAATCKIWRERNREHIQNYYKKYYARNKEAIRSYYAGWAKKNREKVRAYQMNYRLKKKTEAESKPEKNEPRNPSSD